MLSYLQTKKFYLTPVQRLDKLWKIPLKRQAKVESCVPVLPVLGLNLHISLNCREIFQLAVHPPSIGNAIPVIVSASSLQKNLTAAQIVFKSIVFFMAAF